MDNPEVFYLNQTVINVDELSLEQLYKTLANGFDEIDVSHCSDSRH